MARQGTVWRRPDQGAVLGLTAGVAGARRRGAAWPWLGRPAEDGGGPWRLAV